MLEWFGVLADKVLSLGYPGVFLALVIEGLGLPFPGDAAMAFYGFAASRGDMHFGAVLVMSVLGYMCGSTMAYVVSRRYGGDWLEMASRRIMMSERSMMRTSGLLNKYGPWLLVPGRFLPGVRSVSSYVAGAGRMDFQSFLLYTVIGATLWCACWIGVGFWCGEHFTVVMKAMQSGLAYLTGGVLVVIICFLLYRRKIQ